MSRMLYASVLMLPLFDVSDVSVVIDVSVFLNYFGFLMFLELLISDVAAASV